jgi:hypothetical protein
VNMPISREATTTLQRLVGILRGEGGEMYAARAPEVRSDFSDIRLRLDLTRFHYFGFDPLWTCNVQILHLCLTSSRH